MTNTSADTQETVRWQNNWRVAVPVGLVAVVISLVLIPLAPFVVLGVLSWWLHIDLTDVDRPRLGWLGVVAFVLFGVLSTLIGVVVVGFDSHFECGGTLGGFGESASARLDESCVDARAWRSILAAVLLIVVVIAASVKTARRNSANEFGVEQPTESRVPVAPVTIAVLLVIDVIIVTAIVLT